jgi:signal transduction histidine kinase/CheY-like chemotaxis protein
MREHGTEALIGILLLTDNTDCHKRIDDCLGTSTLTNDLLAVASVDEGLGVLKEASFEVVLVDSSLLADTGLDAISSACANSVVLLISNGSPYDYLPSGVQDCIDVDSMNGVELVRRITYAMDRAACLKRGQKASIASSPFGRGFFRQIFDASAHPILVLNRSQEIILLNASASELLESEPNSLIGEVSPFNAYSGENVLIEIPDTDGRIRQMELQPSDFFHNGELCTLVLLHDVSRHTESLAPSGQRGSRMDQSQEVSSDYPDANNLDGALQNESLQSIGHLAGGIAHDFNNILTAVLGNLSIVRMALGASHSEAEKLLSAEKAVLQAKSLTRQLLTFSKGGGPEMEATTIDQLVRDCAELVLRGSNVRYEFSAEPNLWIARADKGQISQVINNLLINADQAMPSGGVLSISLENRNLKEGQVSTLSSGGYICLKVSDCGTGISPENLKRIFEPYFTTKESGDGLGLASCFSILKRHGGLLTVDSKLGVGSTFSVFLPKSESPVEISPAEVVSLDEDKLPPAGSGRILIMDDMEPMKQVAGEILTMLGYDVFLTADGVEAIQAYREAMEKGEPFRAVVFDLTVPGGMGGEEACRQIREYDPDLLAVASSGYSTSNVMSDWESFGFNAVVAKPYRIKDMGWTLHRLFHPCPSAGVSN